MNSGVQRTQTRTCSACKKEIPLEANFCPSCGQKVIHEENAAVVSQAADEIQKESLSVPGKTTANAKFAQLMADVENSRLKNDSSTEPPVNTMSSEATEDSEEKLGGDSDDNALSQVLARARSNEKNMKLLAAVEGRGRKVESRRDFISEAHVKRSFAHPEDVADEEDSTIVVSDEEVSGDESTTEDDEDVNTSALPEDLQSPNKLAVDEVLHAHIKNILETQGIAGDKLDALAQEFLSGIESAKQTLSNPLVQEGGERVNGDVSQKQDEPQEPVQNQ